MSSARENTSLDSNIQKEWDEITCPICLNHPHNAVLLICTSHTNGCRSYICDTSNLHSNCLDRFKNLQLIQSNSTDNNSEAEKLKCPLCRGNITSWEVVKEARQHWNAKTRSCSQESCEVSGNCEELQQHVSKDHPTSRPSDVDPTRQHAWRQMELERDFGDLLSIIRAAMPDGVMLGDYVLDNDSNDNDDDGDDDSGMPWWAALFFYYMVNGPHGEPRVPQRRRRRRRRGSTSIDLWGERLLGLYEEDDDIDGDDGSVRRPRRRRRSRDDEEQ